MAAAQDPFAEHYFGCFAKVVGPLDPKTQRLLGKLFKALKPYQQSNRDLAAAIIAEAMGSCVDLEQAKQILTESKLTQAILRRYVADNFDGIVSVCKTLTHPGGRLPAIDELPDAERE